MLNKITFTGRETMLTNGVKEDTVKKLHEYVGSGKIYTKEEIEKVQKFCTPKNPPEKKAQYSSPYALVNESDIQAKESARNGFSYNVAHGKPADEAQRIFNEVEEKSAKSLNLMA